MASFVNHILEEKKMFERIKEMLVDELGIDAADVTPDAKLKGNLGISSVEFVDIAMTIEEEYNIELNEDKLRKVKTVQELCDYVESLIK